MGNRLVLNVVDSGTSKIALGEEGAEHLLMRGHMLAKTARHPTPVFAQVPFITEDDLEHVVEAIVKGTRSRGQ